MFYFLLLILSCSSVFASERKFCTISQPSQHASNQQLLQAIIKQELRPNLTPEQQAEHLSARITPIAQALLKKGFQPEAYALPSLNANDRACFNAFALWEGEKNEGIPLTFFVYVWPCKECALKYNPNSDLYASNIHRHPISCAFASLQGTIVQKNFKQINADRVVREIDEESLEPGQGCVDDLKKPFIHQMYGKNATFCLSLHAYGLPSAEKVMNRFRDTFEECSYTRIMQKDGTIQAVPN